jgi:hypothetical protein
MSRDERARDANAFVSERLARATPDQARAIMAEAQRKGIVQSGDKGVVDGRMHSDTVNKIVAGVARSDER